MFIKNEQSYKLHLITHWCLYGQSGACTHDAGNSSNLMYCFQNSIGLTFSSGYLTRSNHIFVNKIEKQ